MSIGRVEPFQLALSDLRERLREGAFAPGARITATEVADTLRLSPTPVREALSRLAGEGLVEDRRGQGFFVRTLTATDIADLYRLSSAYLALAQDPARRPRRPLNAAPEAAPDPVRRVERMFAAWVAEAASRVLGAAYRSLAIQIGPVRRLEPLVIPDLDTEAVALLGLDEAEQPRRAAALRRFHERRVALADQLAAQLEQSSRPGEV